MCPGSVRRQPSNWTKINPSQTAQIFRSFGYTFGFLNIAKDPEIGVERLPFLSTYRDMDIFEKLFVETITGALGPPPRTSAEMQPRLIDRFLRLRVATNYYALRLSDAKKMRDASAEAERIIEKLTIVCANYLKRVPQDNTAFTFNREIFGEIFPSDVPPLDAVVEESELLKEKAGHLVFDILGLTSTSALELKASCLHESGAGIVKSHLFVDPAHVASAPQARSCDKEARRRATALLKHH